MRNLARTRGGSVQFRIKESTKDEKPIYLDFSYGRKKRFRYSIGYSINPKYWDKSKLRVKNVVSIRNSNDINDLMRDLESELLNFISICDAQQIPITNELLKNHLNDFTHKNDTKNSTTDNEAITFFPFIEQHIKQKEKQLSKPKIGTNQTIKSYRQTLKHLTEFQSDTGHLLEFNTIDEEFYSEFIEYMNNKTHGNGLHYHLNTIGKHIKSLITFMNASIYAELHTNFKFKRFKPLSEITDAIYLLMDELQRLANLNLNNKPHLELARDIFIIGCEIGQRIGDYQDLRKHQIIPEDGDKFIKIKQEKTRKVVLCKITPIIQKIMDDRYHGELPPKISSQKLNDHIKKIGQIANINEEINSSSTIGGKEVIKSHLKHNLIMGHTARRTFCTIKHKNGMPIHDIMELSGHTTLKEFLKYIRNSKEERVKQITSTEAFINSSISII